MIPNGGVFNLDYSNKHLFLPQQTTHKIRQATTLILVSYRHYAGRFFDFMRLFVYFNFCEYVIVVCKRYASTFCSWRKKHIQMHTNECGEASVKFVCLAQTCAKQNGITAAIRVTRVRKCTLVACFERLFYSNSFSVYSEIYSPILSNPRILVIFCDFKITKKQILKYQYFISFYSSIHLWPFFGNTTAETARF